MPAVTVNNQPKFIIIFNVIFSHEVGNLLVNAFGG